MKNGNTFKEFLKAEATMFGMPLNFPRWPVLVVYFVFGFAKSLPTDIIFQPFFDGFLWMMVITIVFFFQFKYRK